MIHVWKLGAPSGSKTKLATVIRCYCIFCTCLIYCCSQALCIAQLRRELVLWCRTRSPHSSRGTQMYSTGSTP